MYPQPLMGIAAHKILNNVRKQLRVDNYVGCAILRANQLHRRIETQTIFSELWVPNGESWHHIRIRLQCHSGQPTRSARRDAEKIHKHPLAGNHIGVHENAHRLPLAHGCDQAAGKILIYGSVAVHAAVATRQRIEVRIVQRAHDDTQRMAIQRVRKRGKLPSTQMSSQKQHAFAAREGPFEILKAFVNHHFADVFGGVFRKKTDLSRLPSQGGENSAQNLLAFAAAFFRKREFQVAHAHPAQFSVQQVNGPGDGDSGGTGQWPGERADELYQKPRQRVFESVAQKEGDDNLAEVLPSNADMILTAEAAELPDFTSKATAFSANPAYSSKSAMELLRLTYGLSWPISPGLAEMAARPLASLPW
jgi:alkylated DNA nucleotide flippase Atl1